MKSIFIIVIGFALYAFAKLSPRQQLAAQRLRPSWLSGAKKEKTEDKKKDGKEASKLATETGKESDKKEGKSSKLASAAEADADTEESPDKKSKAKKESTKKDEGEKEKSKSKLFETEGGPVGGSFLGEDMEEAPGSKMDLLSQIPPSLATEDE